MAANRIEPGDPGYDEIWSRMRDQGQVAYDGKLYKEITDNIGTVFVAVGGDALGLDNTYSTRSTPNQENPRRKATQ